MEHTHTDRDRQTDGKREREVGRGGITKAKGEQLLSPSVISSGAMAPCLLLIIYIHNPALHPASIMHIECVGRRKTV